MVIEINGSVIDTLYIRLNCKFPNRQAMPSTSNLVIINYAGDNLLL